MEDSDKYSIIQVSDNVSDIITELNNNLQNPNGETDGFVKLLAKDQQALIR